MSVRQRALLQVWAMGCVAWAILLVCLPEAEAGVTRSRGQTIYVPVYSHVYIGDQERPFLLTTTLSMRNTDPVQSITIQSVAYYDSDGKLLRHYLDKPVTLGPLASRRYVVKESDASGGSGAKFIVRWSAVKPVTQPLCEGVMIGASGQQGISFITRGAVIAEVSD